MTQRKRSSLKGARELRTVEVVDSIGISIVRRCCNADRAVGDAHDSSQQADEAERMEVGNLCNVLLFRESRRPSA